MAKKKRAPARREARLAEEGEIYTFRLPRGLFGACQVTRVDGRSAETVTLDYLETRPPSIEDVPRMAVCRPKWGAWRGDPDRCNVDRRVPWWLERIAIAAPIETFEDECLSYGGWQHAFCEYAGRRWKELDAPSLRTDSTPVHIDLGGGVTSVRRDLGTASIGPGATFTPPVQGRIDFDALDALPGLREIVFAGSDPGFVEYVRRRRITSVEWRDLGMATIDLRESDVETLSLVVGSEPVTLLAPPVLGSLTVKGRSELLTIEGAALGAPFQLELHGPRILPPPRGAEAAQMVEYAGLHDTDASGLASYTALAALTLRGAPGKLHDATALASLQHLRELTIYELYELDGARWPAGWPRLDAVRIEGLKQTDAASLKEKLAEVPHVELARARSDEWIAANVENPFRSWEEDNPAFGRTACAAWKKAKEAARELGKKRPSARRDAEAKASLSALVLTLNELDAKFGIDTMRREEAAEAFFGLARELSIDDAHAAEWLDEWRDF